MSVKFSVIIPVYNVGQYLRECLDSVVAQTFGDWECVCVDDGSKDGSGLILDEYAARDSRFRVFHQPNGGVSMARNRALDEIRGEYVAFLDADDVWDRGMLAEMNRLIDLDSPDVIRIDFTRGALNRFKESVFDCEYELFVNEGLRKTPPEVYFCRECWRVIVRRAMIKHRFRKEIKMGEDELFTLELLCGEVKRIVVSRYAGYLYRDRLGAAMHGWQAPEERLRWFKALEEVVARCKTTGCAISNVCLEVLIKHCIRTDERVYAQEIRKIVRRLAKGNVFKVKDLKFHRRPGVIFYLWFGWRSPIKFHQALVMKLVIWMGRATE